MEPKIQHNGDGTLTISITLPAAGAHTSMLAQEERLLEAVNAVGRAGARHLLGGFDAPGTALLHAGRKWTSKGRVAKIYETPWGEVLVERHLYQRSCGGVTLCPLEKNARIVGGTAASASVPPATVHSPALRRLTLIRHGWGDSKGSDQCIVAFS